MHDCPTCGQETPEGDFCVRCGAPHEQALGHARERSGFAAAPGQHKLVPWPIATLFPHLTHASMRHFRIALGLGGVTVVVLAVLRLFPVALITAALLMVVLTALYFYDVDVYEGEPLLPLAWTFGWGIATGVVVGVITKGVAPSGVALIAKGSTAHTLVDGVLVPALGVVLMLVGPLLLRRQRRYNDVLDGAMFGAASAAAFAAAEAIVVGVNVLGGGVRPQGAAVPWVVRLLTLGIATPVLSMAAVGSATGAIWLRYRAPSGDRNALGPLGHPLIAVPAAAVLVTAGAIGETFMAGGAWLASVIVLALLAVGLLRRALHLGLLEESSKIAIGPEIDCANCGARTATHTFCGNCGIALRALPKVRPDAGGRGESHGRLAVSGPNRVRHRIVLAAVAIGLSAGIGVIIAVLAAPSAPRPVCRSGAECGAPPIFSRIEFAFPGYQVWRSSGLGFTLRYPNEFWKIGQQGNTGVELESKDGSSVIFVAGAPQSKDTPAALLKSQLKDLGGSLLGLSADTKSSDRLLGTNVGLRRGPGAAYVATISSPQGPQSPVSIAAESSSDGQVSIAAIVIAPANDAHEKAIVDQSADDIIASVIWSDS